MLASDRPPPAAAWPLTPHAPWPGQVSPLGAECKLTVLSHLHPLAPEKSPSPQLPLLKAESTWVKAQRLGLSSPTPTPAGAAVSATWAWKPQRWAAVGEAVVRAAGPSKGRSARLSGWGKGSAGVSTIDISSAALLAEEMAIGTR